jgi:hypothetical protein
VNRSPRAAYEFVFLVWWSLEMHPSQGTPLLVERDAALHPMVGESVRSKFALTVGTGKEASVIRVPFQFNDKGSFKRCFAEDDESILRLLFDPSFNADRPRLVLARRSRSSAMKNSGFRPSADAGYD